MMVTDEVIAFKRREDNDPNPTPASTEPNISDGYELIDVKICLYAMRASWVIGRNGFNGSWIAVEKYP